MGVNKPPRLASGESSSRTSAMADSPTNVAVSSVPGSPRPLMIVLAYRGDGSSDTVTLTYFSEPLSRVLQNINKS